MSVELESKERELAEKPTLEAILEKLNTNPNDAIQAWVESVEKNLSVQMQDLSKSFDMAELARENVEKQTEEWAKKERELEKRNGN